jgi:hypothetical protein
MPKPRTAAHRGGISPDADDAGKSPRAAIGYIRSEGTA